jgi:hypothetical protein
MTAAHQSLILKVQTPLGPFVSKYLSRDPVPFKKQIAREVSKSLHAFAFCMINI